MPLKIDEEYRVKRVKSSVNKISSQSYYSAYNNTIKSKESINRSVVKVTSGSKGYKEMSNHIDYISRNGKVDLHTSDNKILKGKSEIIIAKNEMGLQNNKLMYGANNKTNQTYNMVFSLKNFEENSEKSLLNIVEKTLKKKFPNNYFVYAIHKDTSHPHVHVCLNKKDIEFQKNINLNKNILQQIKHIFSQELIKKGIKVKLEQEKREIIEEEKIKDNYKKPTGVFELVEHGKAPFKNDINNKESYFVSYKTMKNEIVTIWGKNIEKEINKSGAKIGDDIKLKKIVIENQKTANWEIKIYQTAEQRKNLEIEKEIKLRKITRNNELRKQKGFSQALKKLNTERESKKAKGKDKDIEPE